MAPIEGIVVANDEVTRFITRCLMAVGTKQDHAETMAELLMVADYRGHFSHGLNRLDMYVHDVETSTTEKEGEPTIIRQTPATAHVNGANLLGPTVGKFCIDLAIKKAKEVGIGWVVAKGSNHFGICGWYSMRAMNQGLLGMAFTNTSPLVVPTRSREPVLGTNPITLAAPANGGDSFVLDMASSTVAIGKVEINDRKEMPIPNGWGVDAKGKETNDPKAVLDDGGLSPLGGTEECGGYKGYGLGMMVEVFCGMLSGSNFGPHIRKWRSADTIANLGQCFVAIDPNVFEPGFEGRMSSLMDYCRKLQPIEGETEVLIPGDPEKAHMAQCDKQGGIPYHPNLIKHMSGLAQKLKVPPMKTVG